MFAFTKLMQAMVASGSVSDPQFYLTTLLLSGNGTNGAQNNTFLDSSTNAFTITRNGNTTQGTFTPFSQTGWGNYFDGSSYLTTASSATLGISGDFTYEAWVYCTSTSTQRFIMPSSVSLVLDIVVATGSNMKLQFFDGGSVFTDIINTFPINTWTHVSVVRSGSATNNCSFYVNGVRGTQFTTTATNGTVSIAIGYYSSQYYYGYISNLRFCKSAVYSGASFTPSTSALTTTSQGATNCVLLTCQSNRFVDNSSNAFSITPTGTPSVQAFSPFAPASAYDSSTVGGSGYFDGSGDYLSAASNANLTPASSTYTFECWVYRTASGAMTVWDTSVTNGFYVHINGSNKLVLRAYGTADIITSSLSMPVSAWTHVAVARGAANSTKMWINGSSSDGGSATDSTTYVAATTYIGAYDASSIYLNGYIAGMRFVKGSDVYGVSNSTITVPTAPPTAITNTSLLLNFTNAGIIDNTAKNDLETVGNAQISTTQSKFGGSSMYFDGTGDWLSIPSSQFYNFGTGDFTIECWLYPTASSVGTIIAKRAGSNSAWLQLYYDSTNKIGVVISFDGSTWGVNSLGSTTVSLNTWTHVALVRNGTSFKTYINGTADISATNSGSIYFPSDAVTVGAGATSGIQTLTGYIDDLRITRYARYTTTFTAPTAAFPLS